MSNKVYVAERHNDGTFTVRCFDKEIGYIQKVRLNKTRERAYRCVTVLGEIMYRPTFDAAKRADAAILPGIAKGDFAPLMGWLRANVHGLGSKLSTDELLTKATGRPLDPAVFKAHLKARYLA